MQIKDEGIFNQVLTGALGFINGEQQRKVEAQKAKATTAQAKLAEIASNKTVQLIAIGIGLVVVVLVVLKLKK